MYVCLICIGSNYEREKNAAFARERLIQLFPSIRFGMEQETQPCCISNPALFTNQLALFSTDCDKNSVIDSLKEIEKEAGRLPEDKYRGKVVLDIDLIKYDNEVLKPLVFGLSDSLSDNL